MVKTHIK